MILCDYSQLALASIFEFYQEFIDKPKEQAKAIIRHITINSLLSTKKKFSHEYGKMVICCDSKNYWRKDIFPHYKEGRKKAREESEIDWDLVFECLNELKADIKEYFPWILLEVERAEADDIFAIMSKYTQDNEITIEGIYDEPQKTVIISSDGDHQQLTKYSNVRQWCPRKKEFIPTKTKTELKQYMLEHIIKGDAGDGVPNIFMPDDFFMTKEAGDRQKSVSKNVLELFYLADKINDQLFYQLPKLKVESKTEFKKNGDPKIVEESEDEFNARIPEVIKRYKQNEQTVIYSFIPDWLEADTINQYRNYVPKADKMILMNYLITHKCQRLLEDLQDF